LRFQEPNGVVPFDEWLATLAQPSKTQNLEAAGKLLAAVMRLAADGHALRRPTSAPLRDGVHALRVKVHRLNYRALYFFAGSGTAVFMHGCTKEGDVADADLDRAIARRLAYISDPGVHTAQAS